MKKYLFTLLCLSIVLLSSNILSAKPQFTKSKYLIAVLSSGSTGVVAPGTVNYPLVYYSDRNNKSALETDYWIIKEQENNQYSFQNAKTLRYIRYDMSAASDRVALTLVPSLASDGSTSFTLELKKTESVPYFLIRSVINPTKVWNKRESLYESLYPVGVYSGSGGDNELFVFYDSEGESVINKPDEIPINRTLGAFQNYANSLSFNSKTPVVDTQKKEFYLTVPEGQMGSSITMKIRFKLKNAAHTLFIDKRQVSDGEDFNFGQVSATTKLSIEIRNNSSVVASGTLLFSCLPLVQVFSETNIGSVYKRGGLVVTEPNKPDSAEVLHINIKVRGALSSGLPKKAFAIKLKDTDGQTSIDRSFFELRNDNNWILDAMHIDPARMRNRVSTDLWNDFATKPYFYSSEPNLVNGTRGHFVEVFINDAYQGLYCMTEKIDRKQLKLKKLQDEVSPPVIRGLLHKGKGWESGTFGGNLYWDGRPNPLSTNYDNKSSWWSGFETKYPQLDDGEPIDWKPLVDAITVSSHLTNDADFKARVASNYDLPLFIDYYLFIELLLATDNHGKNTYLSVYDKTKSNKVSITPWDCDGTWGRRWDGSSGLTAANQDFDAFITQNEHGQNNLYLRLKSANPNDYKNQVKKRYYELRGNYFSHENLMNRFMRYNELFVKSGAGARERSKWGIGDFANEMTFISNWITARLQYLDQQYLGGPYIPPVSLQDIADNPVVFGPNPVRDILIVSNLSGNPEIQIISLQGEVIMYIQTSGNTATIDMSQCVPGIYLLKIGNKVSKLIKTL